MASESKTSTSKDASSSKSAPADTTPPAKPNETSALEEDDEFEEFAAQGEVASIVELSHDGICMSNLDP